CGNTCARTSEGHSFLPAVRAAETRIVANIFSFKKKNLDTLSYPVLKLSSFRQQTIKVCSKLRGQQQPLRIYRQTAQYRAGQADRQSVSKVRSPISHEVLFMTAYRPAMRPLRIAGVSLFLLTLLGTTVLGQTNKADIVGNVKDSSGGAVSGATVTITKVDTGAERTVTSGDQGEYNAPLLEIGTYKVTVTKQGFQTVNRENVVLQTNDRLRVDVELKPGEVNAQVTITSATSLVETDTSDKGSVVTGREVTELPLSGRNFTQL